jgi:hypothetical protein
MRSSRVSCWAVTAALLLCTDAWAQSQATTGVIEGTVSDDSGERVLGARILIRNTATNREQTALSDVDGRFRAPLLPLGPYQLTVSHPAYAKLVREGISLTVGRTVSLELRLQPAGITDQILVVADAPSIETARTESATLIEQVAVEGVPNNGRNFLELTKLTPGVSIVQGPDGEEITINGQKGIQNNISVDGADFNNPFFGEQRGGQRPAFTFNLDAIQEIVVIADGASAEFGRSSSGFINVITKSGTNDLRGTAHFFAKHDSVSALPKLPNGELEQDFDFEQQQAGFTLGGPLKRDRAFFFLAFDGQRGRSTKQTDPNRIEPRVVEALARLGSPEENGPIERTNDARVLLTKLDWAMGSRHNLTLRYNYTWSEQQNGTFDVDSWGRSANAIEKDRSHAVSGAIVSALGARVYNELRFQFAREDRPRPYDGPNVLGQSRPLPDTAFDFGRGYRFGMPFFIPVEYYDTRLQLNNNVSILAGAHAIKAGVELNHVDSRQTFIGFANGRYIFSSTDGFLNYVANPRYVECSDGSSSAIGLCPPGTRITGPVLLYLQQAGVGGISVEEAGTQSIPQTEPAVFVQDEWSVSDRLTLSFGLRWEAQIQPDPITPPDQVFYAPFIGQTVDPDGPGPLPAQEFPSNGKIPSDWKMFQPRIGLALDPFGDARSVVRATAGIYAARIPGLVLASSRSTNGSRGQTLFRNSELTDILGPVPAYPNLIPASQVGAPFFPGVFVFDKDFQNPRTYAASLSFERELVSSATGLIKLNYAATRNLTRFIDRNDPVFGAPWSSGLAPAGINGIGSLTVVESSAKSDYWGLTLGLGRRWADNFLAQVNYTYSKDKSDDDNERDPFSFRYARADRLDAEYGYSDRDQRHRLNGLLTARTPGDLDLNLRYSYSSAQPKSIHFNGPGCAAGCDANSPQDRINPDGSITVRNLGRKDNTFSSLDVQISRPIGLGRVSLEPQIAVFNLFNSDNQRSPEVTNLIFNFDGTVQSGAGDPRQVQAGMRLRW